MEKIIKHILLLEDEEHIVDLFLTVIRDLNQKHYENKSNVVFSVDVIQSCHAGISFNLSVYDYIFVDRDNSLGYNNTTNFHDVYIKCLADAILLEDEKLSNIINNTYLISGNPLNNTNLINRIVVSLINNPWKDLTYYVDSREKQNEVEGILKSHEICKSLIKGTDLSNKIRNVLV